MSGIFGYHSIESGQREEYTSRCLQLQKNVNRIYGDRPPLYCDLPGGGMGWIPDTLCRRRDNNNIPLHGKYYQAALDVLLYNREELLQDLEQLVNCDCSDETLLLSWIEEKGIDALARVNGDFAGALYFENQWILFRDHMGVRPLYYYMDSKKFLFSTDILGISQIPFVDTEINQEQLYLRMIRGNYLSQEDTDFRHIKCVRPGSYYVIRVTDQGYEGTYHTYWEPGRQKVRRSTERIYISEFRSLIEDAVGRRAEVLKEPLGADLSGGLDSGVIDIILSRMGKDITFGSWSLPEEELPLKDEDERRIIMDICRREGKDCFFTSGKEKAFGDIQNLLLPPFINTVNISITARMMQERGIHAIFSGHGGDEGVSHRCNELELWSNREYLAAFRELYVKNSESKIPALKALKGMRYLSQRVKTYRTERKGNPTVVNELLQAEYLKRMTRECQEKPFLFGIDTISHIRQGAERPRLDNLAYQGARYGVRYLIPYLDYRVIDYVVSIPRNLYFKNGKDRYIFRKAFEEIMPESLKAVNYKDFPSLRGESAPGDSAELLKKRMEEQMSELGRENWNEFLNIENVEEKYLYCREIMSQQELATGWKLLAVLERCIMIQKLHEDQKQREKEWVK